MKRMKIAILVISVIAFVILLIFALDLRLLTRFYKLESDKISSKVRIALVTDLHSCSYGEGQCTLVDAINAESPDIVLLGGDIFDDRIKDHGTELFLKAIGDKYPCYYVAGNHEYYCGKIYFEEKMEMLRKYGVEVITGKTVELYINGEYINLCGADDPDSFDLASPDDFEKQLPEMSKIAENGHFTLLLSHRPEHFDTYSSHSFDLVLCGHAHGGQWRIPYLLNGLYAPHQGLFPAYAGGLYEKSGTTMIVSRGLARETTAVPRIFNRPELVIVDIE
jgi:predicted MPP superfamily phosphohydrolase